MILTLLACSPFELNISPNPLELGEIDFRQEMPEDGYAQEEVTLTVSGKSSGTLWLPEFDSERLCIKGFAADADFPIELGPISGDQFYLLPVGICGHAVDELDTDVETHVDVLVDDNPEPFVLTVRYTPVRTADP